MTAAFSITLVDKDGQVLDLFAVESRADVGGIGKEIEDRIVRAFDVVEDPDEADKNWGCPEGRIECSRACPCVRHREQ